MASVSIPTLTPPQSRESWITPQTQLMLLAVPKVTERLYANGEQFKSVDESVIWQIAEFGIRTILKPKTSKEEHPPSLLHTVGEHLVGPNSLPPSLTNWYLSLERIGALPDKIPPLPLNIHEILGSPCPIHSTDETHSTVGETHSLYLIPAGTLNELEERVSSYGQKFFQGENPLKFRYFWDPAREEHANVQYSEPQWVLISNDVLRGSRNQPYAKQAQMVDTLRAKSLADYQVPTLREAIAATFLHKVATGESLYQAGNEQNGRLSTYTRVKETTRDSHLAGHLAVGGFAYSGLGVNNSNSGYDYVNEYFGVAALRKF